MPPEAAAAFFFFLASSTFLSASLKRSPDLHVPEVPQVSHASRQVERAHLHDVHAVDGGVGVDLRDRGGGLDLADDEGIVLAAGEVGVIEAVGGGADDGVCSAADPARRVAALR